MNKAGNKYRNLAIAAVVVASLTGCASMKDWFTSDKAKPSGHRRPRMRLPASLPGLTLASPPAGTCSGPPPAPVTASRGPISHLSSRLRC